MKNLIEEFCTEKQCFSHELSVFTYFPFQVIKLFFSFISFRGLSSDDYVKIIWTTFAEFPGTLLAFALIDWIGRKKTLAFLSFSFAVSTLGVIGKSSF